MKKTAVIILFSIFSRFVCAQGLFTTILSAERVMEGESFRVQYVVIDAASISSFIAPDFDQFRLISGPDIYLSEMSNQKNLKQSKNFVFTLVALKAGKFIIPGATIIVDGKPVKSGNLIVDIIPKGKDFKRFEKESSSDYFLRPGENAQQKINENLFLKVIVDKKNCFVGEPVQATFKLFSRLESKSDIVKNPGFYGFSVYDIVNLSDKELSVEIINRKPYDVHTIRKVQLYPLRPGVFVIEPMEVKNRVEFSGSVVNKKTEQEISEGVLNAKNNRAEPGTEVFETEISTQQVSINVKPVPEKNKPPGYAGAVGAFDIFSSLSKNSFFKNEEGFLEIRINGTGNFIQIDAPVIRWSDGIEGFEPIVKDSLYKTQTPLTGTRIFTYPFVVNIPGKYSIPPVNFSFFNPSNRVYNTVSTNELFLQINETSTTVLTKEVTKATSDNGIFKVVYLTGILILTVIIIIVFWIYQKNKKTEIVPIQGISKTTAAIERVLSAASISVNADDKLFYSDLQQGIWKFMAASFGLSGSEMNKDYLVIKMSDAGVAQTIIKDTASLLSQCEEGLYTNTRFDIDKNEILERTRGVLHQISQTLL
jgi:hypothetical protein